jgi:hypothetical protein
MTKYTLYNGKQFPDYIFANGIANFLFFDFDLLFGEEFWVLFKKVLRDNDILNLILENIKPDYFFKEEISVENLPKSFIESVRTEKLESYFSFKTSFYLLCEEALIYPRENESLFCVYLDRRYSIAILGFSHLRNLTEIEQFRIADIKDHLSMSFGGEPLPKDFEKEINKNWMLS